MYLNGLGVPRNYGEALKLFRKAAEQGILEAQEQLELMYVKGMVSPKDQTDTEGSPPKAPEPVPHAQDSEETASIRERHLVAIRDRNGSSRRRISAKQLRLEANGGLVDMKSEVMWNEGQGWYVLEDFFSTDDGVRRAENELDIKSHLEILVDSSRSGDYELIKGLLALKPDLLNQNNYGLPEAIQNGHAICVRLLVARGANHPDRKVIDAAVERGDPEINRYLNPTEDSECAAVLEAASEDARKIRASNQRRTDIYKEVHALEQQINSSRIPVKDGLHIPKCPTCESTDIIKVSIGAKGLAAVLIGVLSIGYLGKTFQCNNCGNKW
jgi:hypothetical protein